MMIFDTVRDFIQNLNRKEMIRWGSLYVGICVALMIGLMVRHVWVGNETYNKMVQLNKSRATIQQIFTKFQIVQQQKNKIDEALKKDKNFNIQKFVQELIVQKNMASQVSSRFAHEKLPNGYTQESLTLTCTQITTQQLCELILAIEQQTLMYITFVDITHMIHAKKINVSMMVATLRAEE